MSTTMLSKYDLKQAFDAVEPFIQNHTAIVCPSCENVCCINKHSYYNDDDKSVITACGVEVPEREVHDRNESDPCKFLGMNGCVLERWRRPFRCTFYFCEQLLESMRNDKPRAYREFVASFQRLVAVREKLIQSV